jgi:dihydroorotate dehydrogenase
MLDKAWPYMRHLLHAMEPERAHELTLAGLEHMPMPRATPDDRRLAVNIFGLHFSNPVGVAPGFDKDARVPAALHKLGFGFAEVGTLTPKAQEGNPRPRIFRLEEHEAVINRLGFNNGGHLRAHARLAARKTPGIIGVNIGANKESDDKIADYVTGIAVFTDVADYLTINISSPNTPHLRKLQTRGKLDELLARCLEARERAAERPPVLVKIAPDLSLEDLDDITSVALARGADGLIVSNTTLARPGIESTRAQTIGGLSGKPLFALSTYMLAQTYQRVEGKIPLIGVGGIHSGETALAKIRAGATLVQLYTALIYQGPQLVTSIKEFLVDYLDRQSLPDLLSEIGKDAQALCEAGPPIS